MKKCFVLTIKKNTFEKTLLFQNRDVKFFKNNLGATSNF